jgi:hypothetical protein
MEAARQELTTEPILAVRSIAYEIAARSFSRPREAVEDCVTAVHQTVLAEVSAEEADLARAGSAT